MNCSFTRRSREVPPATALAVGLQVDVEALPVAVRQALRAREVKLDDPAVTLQLLQLDAVVGVRGRVSADGTLESIGITCALCHSVVDDSLAAWHRAAAATAGPTAS